MVFKIRFVIPEGYVKRTHLEYPTENVCFSYLAVIDKVTYSQHRTYGPVIVTKDVFTDKAVFALVQTYEWAAVFGRFTNNNNHYYGAIYTGGTTSDVNLQRISAGTYAYLAVEAVDLDTRGRGLMMSVSGSTFKLSRFEVPTPVDPLSLPTPTATISATDTTFTSGHFGFEFLRSTIPHGSVSVGSAYLKPPASPHPPALAILEVEVEVEGSGTTEDPFKPLQSKNLIEITPELNIPEFLKQEKKKYDILRSKGFTDEEIQILLGYIPQHQIDINAVTWGAFEFNPQSPTNIITIFGDNPYQSGAVERQIEYARAKNLRVLPPPANYGEAVSQYNRLKHDFPHWLAGKDNYAYQTLGWEELDVFQNVDFYYGELIEHRKHYDQLKQVPEAEIWRRLEELERKLVNMEVLHEERDKHMDKLKEIKKKGW